MGHGGALSVALGAREVKDEAEAGLKVRSSEAALNAVGIAVPAAGGIRRRASRGTGRWSFGLGSFQSEYFYVWFAELVFGVPGVLCGHCRSSFWRGVHTHPTVVNI